MKHLIILLSLLFLSCSSKPTEGFSEFQKEFNSPSFQQVITYLDDDYYNQDKRVSITYRIENKEIVRAEFSSRYKRLFDQRTINCIIFTSIAKDGFDYSGEVRYVDWSCIVANMSSVK